VRSRLIQRILYVSLISLRKSIIDRPSHRVDLSAAFILVLVLVLVLGLVLVLVPASEDILASNDRPPPPSEGHGLLKRSLRISKSNPQSNIP
jgi:hypothetical protein